MRKLLFPLLLLASFILWRHALAGTLSLALENEAYTHILLILPVSCALIYVKRSAAARFEPCMAAGISVLAAAILITAGAKYAASLPGDIRLSLSMLALVTWWIGSVILCFGTQAFRSFLFPLCFLFLLVPLPMIVVNSMVEFLQRESALSARILFRLIGVPVTQDGVVLSIPGLDIEVAQECSSIRSSLMLVVTTMILAQLFLRSWWRQILLVAAAIPLSIAKNGLRIVVIGELGTRVDPGYLTGGFHHHGGVVFLSLGIAAIVALLLLFRRTELPPARSNFV
jgi:exosortase